MYKTVEWTKDLDLTNFYATAAERGFTNNASQGSMIDCFSNEKLFKAWILYHGDNAIGSVAAHSFNDVMGYGSYRVLARTCTFGEYRPINGLSTPRKLIEQHQNLTDQFLLPTCISWAGKENIYATSNNSEIASQRLVHKHYFPTLQKLGIVENVKEVYYRGIYQTVWKIHADKFLENLNRYPRWNS